LEIGAAHRSEVGVHDRRDGPLVLTELGRHLVRRRHVETALTQDGGDGAFVRGIEIGVQQADGDGFRAVRNRRYVSERFQLGAVGREPARHAEAPRPRYEGLRPVRPLVVERGPVLAADLDHVLQPGVRDQRHCRAASFQQRVGGHRGAVGQHRHGERRQTRRHCRRRVGRVRRHLGQRAVGRHHVGERAARIDSYAHSPIFVAGRRSASPGS